MKDDINDPVDKKNLLGSSFPGRLSSSFVDWRGGGIFEGGRARRSKSFGIFRYGCRVFWSLWLLERLNVFVRLSSGPPGGRPQARLKAGTREAPTSAPTTITLVPQQ